MYTEYNSQNINQNTFQNHNDGEDSAANKIFGVIWKVLLVVVLLVLLFLGLIQFGVISLTSSVSPDAVLLNVNQIGIKKGRGYQLVSTVLPENANNKKVVFESSDPSIASVNEVTGYIKGLKVGTAIISVKTLINEKVSECVVTVEDDGVVVQSIHLNQKNINLAVGYTQSLSYKISPINATELTTRFYSSDSSVATVDSRGVVRGIKEGNAIITVSTNNNSITDTAYVTVYKKGTPTIVNQGENIVTNNYPKTIALSSKSLNLNLGTNSQLRATITPNNAVGTLSWSSSNTSVAIVNENGLVTSVGIGSADIVVKTVNGITASCKVTVGNYSLKVRSISITTKYSYMNVGASQNLYVVFEPSNASDRTISWSSSNSSVVSVDASGKITALNPGSAIITAKSRDGGYTSSATIEVGGNTNIIDVSSIGFNKSIYEVGINSTAQSIINYNPSNATYKAVTFVSSNPSVATVDENGLIKGISAGNTVITATTKHGNAKATVNVRVKNIPASSVSLNQTEVSLNKNGIFTLSAQVNPNNASDKTVNYSSNNNNVAVVDKYGTITAKESGTAIITVTPNGGGASSTCIVRVS